MGQLAVMKGWRFHKTIVTLGLRTDVAEPNLMNSFMVRSLLSKTMRSSHEPPHGPLSLKQTNEIATRLAINLEDDHRFAESVDPNLDA